MRSGHRRVHLAAASLVLVGALSAFGAGSVMPGTAKQVAALVAEAPKIVQLPPDVTPSLANAGADDASHEYPAVRACIVGVPQMPACVFGDTHGARTMVLWGDSHAHMWFPALDTIAKAAKWRLVALMGFGCPVANVTVWNIATNQTNSGCPPFRSAMIKRINRLHPSLVVMSEGYYTLDGSHGQITTSRWTRALESTFAALHAKNMKKVLLGNTFLLPNPIECLASNLSSIQACSLPDATAAFSTELASERAAASRSKVTYVSVIPWTCSSVCTVVIGKMIAYYSSGHISATYANYLSGVIRGALKSSMR